MRRALLFIAIVACVSACSGSNPNGPTDATPNIQGHWSGSWTNQACTAAADFLAFNACSTAPSSGAFDLVLTQNGSTVQGTLTIAAFPFTVSGSVANDGRVSLSGHGTNGLTGDLSNWATQVASTTMTGTFTFIFTLPGVAAGNVSIRAGLLNVARVS